MSTFFKIICFIFLTSGNLFSQIADSEYKKLDAKIILAEELIEEGSINIAYLILDKSLKTNGIPKDTKYRMYKDIAKIHLYEQDLVNYEKYNRKAFELKKNDGEIYKGMYFAEKAFFWHYITWADSATYYSNLSMEIIQRNRTDFPKISVAFVYQVYAVTFLYRKINPADVATDKFNTPKHRILMHQWFDSAKVYEKKFPYQFNSDRVMLYRGIGNRYVDAVSYYNFRDKSYQKKMTALEWYSFRKANENYILADKNTNPKNWNDRLLTEYMKGVNFMSIGEKVKAKNVFNSIIKAYFSIYKKVENSPNTRLLINVISLKVTNDLNLPYDEHNINQDIYLLKKLRDNWWEHLIQSAEYNYDTYNLSPNTHLYNLYKKKYFVCKKKKYLSLATSYYLTHINQFRFYKQFKQTNSFRFKNALLEFQKLSNQLLKEKIRPYIIENVGKIHSAPLLEVGKIQNKLQSNEGVLIPVSAFKDGSKKTYKIFISKNQINVIESRIDIIFRTKEEDTISFSNFKKEAYQDYQLSIKKVIEEFPKVNKIYTMYFDFSNYGAMIEDTIGNNFHELKYLAKKIQFTTVYNLYDYFTTHTIPPTNHVDFVRLKNSNFNNLPFSNHLARKSFPPLKSTFNDFKGNLTNLLTKKGILHLYGHSQFNQNKITEYINISFPFQTKSSYHEINDFNENISISRSLIVLNNCYSGYNINSNINEYNRSFYLKMLYCGALNVIVSPTKTDDESSSKIFNTFYEKIAEGETTADALYQAQLYYLKTNKGILAHPKFWAPYRLISNSPHPIYSSQKSTTNYYLYLLLLVAIIDAFLFHLYVQKTHS